MKFPDKSVLCFWRKSESVLWHFACMPFPGSSCLLLRNEHRECEQPDKYFLMLGILTLESLYVFTLNFLKPHHLVSFFPLLLANIFFFATVVNSKKIRDIHDQFGGLCFAPNWILPSASPIDPKEPMKKKKRNIVIMLFKKQDLTFKSPGKKELKSLSCSLLLNFSFSSQSIQFCLWLKHLKK